MTKTTTLTTQSLNIFFSDIAKFLKTIDASKAGALCSDERAKQSLNQQYNLFEGAGGYLATYLRLYEFFSSNKEFIEAQKTHITAVKDEEFF